MRCRSVVRWATGVDRSLVLLTPADGAMPHRFDSIAQASDRYDRLLANMQRLRGAVYIEDGAIQADDLSEDGRHVSPADERAWHVLSVDSLGRVCGCARYLTHRTSVTFSELGIRNSALAAHPRWGDRLRRAVESEMALARRRGVSYVEVGGWALDKSARRSFEALRIALATYALSRRLGGCIGISTATIRHCSATILQKIGGRMLDHAGITLPSYFEPTYGCEMMMLRFDSNETNERYSSLLDSLYSQFATVPVIMRSEAREPASDTWPLLAEPLLTCA